MDGIRIAIDVNYPDLVMGKLSRRGFQIMIVAKQGQHDEDWLSDAMALDVEAVLSHDLDIPNWLDSNGYLKVNHFESVEDLTRFYDKLRRSKTETPK